MNRTKPLTSSKTQLIVAIVSVLGLVVWGGMIIRNGEQGTAFYGWVLSAVLLVVATFIRIRSQGRPGSSRAADNEFRRYALVAVLLGFVAMSQGVQAGQAHKPEMVWANGAMLVGAAAIGVVAYIRRQKSSTSGRQ